MKKKADIDILNQHWVHSHEEDTDTELVFRPSTFKFPVSRGRKSFELKKNGNLVEYAIGPTDRPQEVSGTWILEDGNYLTFNFDSPSVPKRVMHIASVDKDRLVIQKKQ